MVKITVLFLFLFFLLFPQEILAIYDPLSVPNNRYGIHITQESDITDAANLVNSAGGDWGYVTLVIQKGERNLAHWQNVFNRFRRLHLIPLVRIATAQLKGGWEKPSEDEIDGWVDFLGSLNWPTANRYVIVGNEPNHAKEWGGEISPEGYADYLKKFSRKAKAKSDDFFILPAALDFSAATNRDSFDAAAFIQRMLKAHPDLFDWVDGLNSHSYPNPDFSGNETAKGRGTVATFLWEESYLKSLGVNKEFPIFITETGWAHKIESQNNGYLDPAQIGSKLKLAFENTWNHPRVVVVTPFIINYQSPPFDIFSWKKPDGSFYPFFETVKSLAKTKGEPVQKTSGEILRAFLPAFVEPGQTFTIALLLKNTGQSIWNEEEVFTLRDIANKIEITKVITLPKMEPGENKIVLFEARLIVEAEKQLGYLTLFEGKNIISNAYPFEIRLYKPQNFLEYFISIKNSVAVAILEFFAKTGL